MDSLCCCLLYMATWKRKSQFCFTHVSFGLLHQHCWSVRKKKVTLSLWLKVFNPHCSIGYLLLKEVTYVHLLNLIAAVLGSENYSVELNEWFIDWLTSCVCKTGAAWLLLDVLFSLVFLCPTHSKPHGSYMILELFATSHHPSFNVGGCHSLMRIIQTWQRLKSSASAHFTVQIPPVIAAANQPGLDVSLNGAEWIKTASD